MSHETLLILLGGVIFWLVAAVFATWMLGGCRRGNDRLSRRSGDKRDG